LVVLDWLLLDIELIEIKIIYRLVGIKDRKVIIIIIMMQEEEEKVIMLINMININIIINQNKEIEE
jgi:hypothetical protein